MLNYEDSTQLQDEDELNRIFDEKIRGRCSFLKRCIYDCKREDEKDYDITNVNLGLYFENLSSTLEVKMERDRRALRNWQKINMRLALFRNLRKKVKDKQDKCTCFER